MPHRENVMPRSALRFLVPLVLGLCCLAAAADLPAPPPTPKKPVTDEYHGSKVVDDYRWLENAKDPAVRDWIEEQNRFTHEFFEHLSDLDAIRKRLKDLVGGTSPDYTALRYRKGTFFALKSQPPKNQPFLVTLRSVETPLGEQVVLDPNKLDPKGTTTIDFYVPSLDGRLVAVSMSEGGSENGTVHVYETATGKELPDVIPRVYGGTAGGSVAWNADGSGFWYTRYPRADERPKTDLDFYQQVWFHKLGTPTAEDVYSLGKDFPRIAEIVLETREDGRYVLATVANGDGGEFAHFILTSSSLTKESKAGEGKWIQVTHFADQVTTATFGPDDSLFLLSHHGTPRGEVLRLSLDAPQLDKARVVVSAGLPAIQGMLATAKRLYVVDLVGGPSQVRVFNLDGGPEKSVPLPPIASVAEPSRPEPSGTQIVRLQGDAILLRVETYTQPPAWYRYDPATGEVARTALYRTSPADFSDIEVVREFSVSKDGTRVPLNILRPKGTQREGNNPTLLYGYGGYNISQVPRFQVARKVWLEQGGVYAVANLRGGGEYGEEWHTGGNLTHKQNVFDDFAACAEWLIDNKYTNPKRLAAEGGSNGGLLMGAALTQHPELFRAVVSHVGIYDMLRVELHPNGAFNVTEFGTVKDPEQFKALHAYSPYHHVKDGTAYPAVFLLTGANDARVDPYNSRKMAARLQAATSSGLPVLLRTSFASGHGVDSSLSERIEEQALVDAFLFHELGVGYKAVP
jgi:prolyl oligopeptidase